MPHYCTCWWLGASFSIDILTFVWWMNVPEILESENLPLPITHLDSYIPVRDLWCVCTWLVMHMYVTCDTVMNATLMHLLLVEHLICSYLTFFFFAELTFQKYLSVQLHVLTPYFTPVRDLWCVCTWLNVHVWWYSDECHTNAPAVTLGTML